MAKKKKFPTTEAATMALAQEMFHGFTDNKATFPTPPTDLAAQSTRIDEVQNNLNLVTKAAAALRAAIMAKDASIDLMEDEMRENISYADLTAKGDDAKLKIIGWSGRAARQPLQKPGQARMLEIINQGAGWFQSDWKEPVDGGSVQFYKIMRRDIKSGGDMVEAGSSTISEATLVNQPRAVELEYTVIAINKAGESVASNSVTITL